jgi:hypothetical protein
MVKLQNEVARPRCPSAIPGATIKHRRDLLIKSKGKSYNG